MKKITIAAALIVALALIFASCGDGTKKEKITPGEEQYDLYADGWVKGEFVSLMGLNKSNLDPNNDGTGRNASLQNGVLKMGGNFKYGDGWQAVIPFPDIFGAGAAVAEYDMYELDIAFTINRDLEDALQWVLVDTDAAASNAYWGELSRWKSANVPDSEELPAEPSAGGVEAGPIVVKDPPAGKEWFKKDTAYTYKGRVLVEVVETGRKDSLVFGTVVSGTSGGGGSTFGPTDGWNSAPVITFTKISFTKYTWDASKGEIPMKN